MNDIKEALSAGSEEWALIAKNLFVPKCVADGVCYEKYSCGRAPKATKKSFN
jgi:hypothetical protein